MVCLARERRCSRGDLATRVGAIRLSADEWLDALQVDRSTEMRERVEALQWRLAQELLTRGLTVVIEWGTWARAERDALRAGRGLLARRSNCIFGRASGRPVGAASSQKSRIAAGHP